MRKRTFLLAFGVLLFCACEQELEFADPLSQSPSEVTTRSSVSIPTIAEQLVETQLPFNLIVVANMPSFEKNYKFLSAQKSGNTVHLYTKDDGSLRQKWYLKRAPNPFMVQYYITLAGGNKSFKEAVVVERSKNSTSYPILVERTSNLGMGTGLEDKGFDLKSIPNTNYYYISREIGNWHVSKPYLQAKDTKNQDLIFDTNSYKNLRDTWEVKILEDFQLRDVKYLNESSNIVRASNVLADTYHIPDNNSPSPVSHTVELTYEKSNSSSFSEVRGLSFSNKISTGIKVGLPEVNTDLTINEEFTSAANFNYTESESTTQKETKKVIFTTSVPAYQGCTIKLYVVQYDMTVTYYATLVGKTTGKILKLKGTWKGVRAEEHYYDRIYTQPLKSGQEIKIEGIKHISECPHYKSMNFN